MKKIVTILAFILCTFSAYAQFGTGPSVRLALGEQTTNNKYLIILGNGAPGWTPAADTNAYVYIDTTASLLYQYSGGAWNDILGDFSAGENNTTTDYIPYWDGDSWEDSNVHNTGENIGISTVSFTPLNALHIKAPLTESGDLQATALYLESTNGNALFRPKAGASASFSGIEAIKQGGTSGFFFGYQESTKQGRFNNVSGTGAYHNFLINSVQSFSVYADYSEFSNNLRLTDVTEDNTNTDILAIDPITGEVESVDFSSIGIPTNNTTTNYIPYWDGDSWEDSNLINSYIGYDGVTSSVYFGLDAYGSGTNGVYIGRGAGKISSGSNNVVIGRDALSATTTGGDITAIGMGAMTSATGANNTAIGKSALAVATSQQNTAMSENALNDLTSGQRNTAIGYKSQAKNTIASSNTTLGWSALELNIDGGNNTVIGSGAGQSYQQINSSILIGASTTPQLDSQSNQIVIGYALAGNGSNTTTIGNSSTTDTYLAGNLNIGTITNAGSLDSVLVADGNGKIGFVPATDFTSTGEFNVGTSDSDYNAGAKLVASPEVRALHIFAVCTSGASADVTITLPTPSSTHNGKKVYMKGLDENGTYNITIDPGTNGALNGGSVVSTVNLSSSALIAICQLNPSNSSYYWVIY